MDPDAIPPAWLTEIDQQMIDQAQAATEFATSPMPEGVPLPAGVAEAVTRAPTSEEQWRDLLNESLGVPRDLLQASTVEGSVGQFTRQHIARAMELMQQQRFRAQPPARVVLNPEEMQALQMELLRQHEGSAEPNELRENLLRELAATVGVAVPVHIAPGITGTHQVGSWGPLDAQGRCVQQTHGEPAAAAQAARHQVNGIRALDTLEAVMGAIANGTSVLVGDDFNFQALMAEPTRQPNRNGDVFPRDMGAMLQGAASVMQHRGILGGTIPAANLESDATPAAARMWLPEGGDDPGPAENQQAAGPQGPHSSSGPQGPVGPQGPIYGQSRESLNEPLDITEAISNGTRVMGMPEPVTGDIWGDPNVTEAWVRITHCNSDGGVETVGFSNEWSDSHSMAEWLGYIAEHNMMLLVRPRSGHPDAYFDVRRNRTERVPNFVGTGRRPLQIRGQSVNRVVVDEFEDDNTNRERERE